MRTLAIMLLASWCWPARAHGVTPALPGWNGDPFVLVPLLLCLLGYLAGLLRLWRRAGIGHGIGVARAVGYVAGWCILAGALLSPLHQLGEQLFTAHMLEHELVMVVSAPLLVLGRPVAAFCRGLSVSGRAWVLAVWRQGIVQRIWSVLVQPAWATSLHGAAIWLWHLPGLFEAATGNLALHRLQHLSFLLTALLFWWALLRRRQPLLGVAHLFVTMMHTGLLGALLAFAPRVFYAVQTATAPHWGLTPLEDQQLAGLLMWVPGGVIYALAALSLLGHGLRHGRRNAGGIHAIATP